MGLAGAAAEKQNFLGRERGHEALDDRGAKRGTEVGQGR